MTQDDRDDGERVLMRLGNMADDDPTTPIKARLVGRDETWFYLHMPLRDIELHTSDGNPYAEWLHEQGGGIVRVQERHVLGIEYPDAPPGPPAPVEAVAVWQPAKKHLSGRWSLLVHCERCGRVHQHGGGDGEKPSFGHRWADDCTGDSHAGRVGYVLVEPEPEEDEPERQANTRRLP